MNSDVDSITDIEELRLIAKWRGEALDRYEGLVGEIVPSSHFAWKLRTGVGKLEVLKNYCDDMFGNDNETIDKLMPEDAARYLARCISTSINGFLKVYPGSIAENRTSQLSSKISANLIQNRSMLTKWCEYKLETKDAYAVFFGDVDIRFDTIADTPEESVYRFAKCVSHDWEYFKERGYTVKAVRLILQPLKTVISQ